MSKKILSLALVVVMLMSMFAFSTSAADLSAGQVGVKIVSDAVVGAPAGTVVTVKGYYLTPDSEDVTLSYANMSLGYDNTAFSVDTSTFAWGSEYYANVFKMASTTCNAAATISNNIVKKFGDVEKGYGWNAGLQLQMAQIGTDAEYTTKTGYPVKTDSEIFSLQFTALKEIEADDVIGLVVSAYGTNFFTIRRFDDTVNTKYVALKADEVVLTEGVAAPKAADKDPVYLVAKQARPNGDNIDLGVKAGFKFADIGITFDSKGTSDNVKNVGANLKVNGADAGTGRSPYVYDVKGDKSEFQYRVVIENVAKDSTDVYTVELFVEMMDGTIITGETVEIKAADVVGNLPA